MAIPTHEIDHRSPDLRLIDDFDRRDHLITLAESGDQNALRMLLMTVSIDLRQRGHIGSERVAHWFQCWLNDCIDQLPPTVADIAGRTANDTAWAVRVEMSRRRYERAHLRGPKARAIEEVARELGRSEKTLRRRIAPYLKYAQHRADELEYQLLEHDNINN